MYFEPTYILVIIGVVITMIASARMKSTFNQYCRQASTSGLTGAEVAKRILDANGIFDVQVKPVSGELTDHYNPGNKTVNLSEPIYNSTSVAALGVAAHECGHAIQDNTGYAPLRFRSSFVPVANIGSKASWIFIIAGILLGASSTLLGYYLLNIGIILFSLAVAFQLITLPVEFNASQRALINLNANGILPPAEEAQAKKVLSAAALTYVAGAASAILQLLRLILLFGGNRRRD